MMIEIYLCAAEEFWKIFLGVALIHQPKKGKFSIIFKEFFKNGVFYLKNNLLARPRFKPATARNTFQHKNTKPQPSVLGYSTS
jgi:hypothetical protein